MTTYEAPYSLGETVRVKSSGEAGTVRGVSFHATATVPGIFLDYKAADGRAVSGWFDADLVEPVRKAARRR